MKPHEQAIYVFRRSLERQLDGDEIAMARRVRNENGSSINIYAMCSVALEHAGVETVDPWEETDTEIGGWYYPWWTLAALVTLRQGQCHPYLRACVAWARLHLRPVQTIRLVRPGVPAAHRSRLSREGMDTWQGDLAVTPGARQLWNLGIPAVERGVAGRVLSHNSTALSFDHPQLGWAADILQRYRDVFDFANISHLEDVKPRRGQSFLLFSTANGDYLSVVAHGYGGTRGPVGAVGYDADKRTVTLYSTSEPVKGAEWDSTYCEIGAEEVEMSSGPEGNRRRLRIPIPPGAALFEWPLFKLPPPTAPDDPRVTQALGLLDAALVGGPLEDQSRTCAEVLRRCIRGDRHSAHQGAKTLERKLR